MEDSTVFNPKAYPIAEGDLSAKILNLIHQAHHYDQLKKGINESKLKKMTQFYSLYQLSNLYIKASQWRFF